MHKALIFFTVMVSCSAMEQHQLISSSASLEALSAEIVERVIWAHDTPAHAIQSLRSLSSVNKNLQSQLPALQGNYEFLANHLGVDPLLVAYLVHTTDALSCIDKRKAHIGQDRKKFFARACRVALCDLIGALPSSVVARAIPRLEDRFGSISRRSDIELSQRITCEYDIQLAPDRYLSIQVVQHPNPNYVQGPPWVVNKPYKVVSRLAVEDKWYDEDNEQFVHSCADPLLKKKLEYFKDQHESLFDTQTQLKNLIVMKDDLSKTIIFLWWDNTHKAYYTTTDTTLAIKHHAVRLHELDKYRLLEAIKRSSDGKICLILDHASRGRDYKIVLFQHGMFL